eukprot:m.336741 g.336741  ORF g.336741 m.336741 type:complete len:319 (+) comp17947_c0_seq1:175-1131(+)
MGSAEIDKQKEIARLANRSQWEIRQETAIKYIRWVPVVNFLYVSFFLHDVPKFADMIKLCEFFGLISALVFTVVATIPLSVGFSDLIEADQRYYTGDATIRAQYKLGQPTNGDVQIGIYGCVLVDRERSLSVDSVWTCLMSMALLSLALIISFFQAAVASAFDVTEIEIKARKRGQRSVNEEEAELICYARARRFWKFASWTSLVTLLLMTFGLAYAYWAIKSLIRIKYPNYYFEDLCKDAGWVSDPSRPNYYVNGSFYGDPSEGDLISNRQDNPTIYPSYLAYVLFNPVMLLTTVVLGYAGSYVLQKEEKDIFTDFN